MPTLLLHTRELDSVMLSQQLHAPLCFQDLKTARAALASREEKRLRRGRGDFIRALVFLVLSEDWAGQRWAGTRH